MRGFPQGPTIILALLALSGIAHADRWVASWTGSAHGPYPVGNPMAQPELKFAFPVPEQGARDQTFRLIVRPDVWGSQTRIRRRMSSGRGQLPSTMCSSAYKRAAAPS